MQSSEFLWTPYAAQLQPSYWHINMLDFSPISEIMRLTNMSTSCRNTLSATVVEDVGALDNAMATIRSFPGTCEISKLNRISIMRKLLDMQQKCIKVF